MSPSRVLSVDGVNIAGFIGCVGEKVRVSMFVGRSTGKRVGASTIIGLTADAGGAQAPIMSVNSRNASRVVEVCTSLKRPFFSCARKLIVG